MPRKRVPKTRNSGTMTEAAFFGWIRSQLRRASMKWRPIGECKRKGRRPYKGPDKRRKWEYQCSNCREFFKGTDIQVDHIKPCGTLTSMSDLPTFVGNLFCEADGLQLLCRGCNIKKREEDRNG